MVTFGCAIYKLYSDLKRNGFNASPVLTDYFLLLGRPFRQTRLGLGFSLFSIFGESYKKLSYTVPCKDLNTDASLISIFETGVLLALFFTRMGRIYLILILILTSGQLWANQSMIRWLEQPIVRLSVASYFMQSEGSEQEKTLQFLELLERAMLRSPPMEVHSLNEYKQIRNRKFNSISEYWDSINSQGWINPLNIKTPNTEVFEKILEFEVQEMQNILDSIPDEFKRDYQMQMILKQGQSLLSLYQMGLGFRDSIEVSTRSWQGVPGFGFLRSVGENFVNPLVRRMIYSSALIDRMRTELGSYFVQVKNKIRTDFDALKERTQTIGHSVIEKKINEHWLQHKSLKILESLDQSLLKNLVRDFFIQLPLGIRRDSIWHGINHAEFLNKEWSAATFKTDFIKTDAPHFLKTIGHFKNWLQRSDIKTQITGLSEWPLYEIASSLAQIVELDLMKPTDRNGKKPVMKDVLHNAFSSERFIESISRLPFLALFKLDSKSNFDDYLTWTHRQKESVRLFLSEPDHLRWLMQMYQLKQEVGEDVFKKELKLFMIRNPILLIKVANRKWLPKIFTDKNIQTPAGNPNRCAIFYFPNQL